MNKVTIEILTNDKFHWDTNNESKRKEMEKSTRDFLKDCDRYIKDEAPKFIRDEFKKNEKK